MKLALYTFNVFRKPADDPVNRGFLERDAPNFAAAESASGFIGRSGYADEPGPPSWGEQVFPRFFTGTPDPWAPSTLSLWADLKSAAAFTYGPVHTEAMRHARQWFDKAEWPPYVLWWVIDRPDWKEAIERFEHLADFGPTPKAFDFKFAFDRSGQPTTLDWKALRK